MKSSSAPLLAPPSKSKGAGRASSRLKAGTAAAGAGVLDEETRAALKRARLEALEADNFVEGGGELGGIEDEDFYVDDNDVTRKAASLRRKPATIVWSGPSSSSSSAAAAAAGRKGGGAGVGSSSAAGGGAALSRQHAPKLRKLQDVLVYELGSRALSSGKGGGGGGGGASGGAALAAAAAASGGIAGGLAGPVIGAGGLSTTGALAIASAPPYSGPTEAAEHYLAAAVGRPSRPARPFCSVCGYAGPLTCPRCGSRLCSSKCKESHQETRCFGKGMR